MTGRRRRPSSVTVRACLVALSAEAHFLLRASGLRLRLRQRSQHDPAPTASWKPAAGPPTGAQERQAVRACAISFRRSQMSSTAGVREPIDFAGIGAVTAYGWGREPLINGLVSGVSAVLPHDGYDQLARRQGVRRQGRRGRAGARTARAASPGPCGPRRAKRSPMRSTRLAPGRAVGVVHSVVLGEVDLWQEFYLERTTAG